MKYRSRNFWMVLFLCVVLAFGLANMIVNRSFVLIPVFLIFAIPSVPLLYFNYSLVRWSVRRNANWDTEAGADGVEPSEFRLIMGKVGGWIFFVFALIVALIQL